jgi:serine/threonine protein kinase/DNA-directed RNA polymerase subunit RPC12/RpoP
MAGQLSEVEAEALLRHLENCQACARAVDAIADHDTLLPLLRRPSDQSDADPAQSLLRTSSNEAVLPTVPGMFSFACSSCGKPLVTKEDQVGKLVRCPACQQVVQVPVPPEPATLAANNPGNPDRELLGFLAPPESPEELGRLGNYRILEVLGKGGMGIVFRAEDPLLQRPVALKAMLPAVAAGANARQRFLREARTAAAVEHDHIVAIHQVGEDRGVPFLAMPLLRGESLEQRLRRAGRLSLPEVVRIGREIALGLAAAHQRGLIHRDIKPANLWLEGEPGALATGEGSKTPVADAPGSPAATGGRVKILDFGLARAASESAQLTQPGVIVGTPAYMAPEQAQGKEVDARCDLFSLGCVLYRMCTGELPFKGANTLAVLRALAVDTPKDPAELRTGVPAALSALILRLLARTPEHRPASAQEVAAALASIDTTVRPVAGAERPRSLRRAVVAVLGLLLTAAVLVGVVRSGRLPFGAPIRDRGDGSSELPTPAGPFPPLDPDWVRNVAVMDSKGAVDAVGAELKRRNPGFEGKVKVISDSGSAIEIDIDIDDIADITPVRALPGAAEVHFRGGLPRKGKLTDLSPLAGLKLRSLLLVNTPAGDLMPLRGMPLEELYLQNLPITSLAPLEGMKLVRLWCNDTNVRDLSPLAGMPLQELLCAGSPVEQLAPLKDMKLTKLWCSDTRITDLTPLHGMPLKELACDSIPVTTLAPLKGLKLTKLWCRFLKLTDLTPLENLPLEELNCYGTPVSDLSFLAGMKLTRLTIQETRVTDLTPLRKLPLISLDVDIRGEQDLAVLRAIKTLTTINGEPAAKVLKQG